MQVDEDVLVRPLDLDAVGCAMHTAGPAVATAQLYAGRRTLPEGYSAAPLGRGGGGSVHVARFQRELRARLRPWSGSGDGGGGGGGDDDALELYFSFRGTHPHAYVTNLDGAIVRRPRLLAIFEQLTRDDGHRLTTPQHIEQLWHVYHLGEYDRGWHLVYGAARLVNNALDDGQVCFAEAPTQEGLRLVTERLMPTSGGGGGGGGGERIDVAEFAARTPFPEHTHASEPVTFSPLGVVHKSL